MQVGFGWGKGRRVITTTTAIPTPAPPRFFIVFTLAEALALVRIVPHLDDRFARNAIAKVRAAVESTAAPPVTEPTTDLLRAKDYRPRARVQHFRMAKAAVQRRERARAAIQDDDYVPCRDEAGGIYE